MVERVAVLISGGIGRNLARQGWRGFWKLNAPKPWARFREFQIHVAAGRPETALADNLRHHFSAGFLICQEKQLTVGNSRREADHRTPFKNKDGLRFFGEELALRAGIAGACAGSDDRGFQSNRLL